MAEKKHLGYIVNLYPTWDEGFNIPKEDWTEEIAKENGTAHGIFDSIDEASTWGSAEVAKDPEYNAWFGLQLLISK